ncbi:hypothetical protein [Methylorubrum populi]
MRKTHICFPERGPIRASGNTSSLAADSADQIVSASQTIAVKIFSAPAAHKLSRINAHCVL